MESAAGSPSLRLEYHRRGVSRLDARLPRLGEERGVVADLAPPAGRALAPRPRRMPRMPPKHPVERGSRGARTLLTMSVIFSWFGL